MRKEKLFVALLGLCMSVGFAQNLPNSKFGKGFKYQAADSSFDMTFHFRMQHLYSATYNEATEETTSKFLVRRSRLKFDGKAFSPKLSYKVELGLTNSDISVSSEDGNGKGASRMILDAVLKYQFSNHWSFWVGQTKLPGNRERVISSANLQFVDRSGVNSNFNIDRDAGVQLRGKYMIGDMAINPSIAVTAGEGRDITSNNFGGYDYTAHVDFLPLGKFTNKKGDYISSDLDREETPKIAFGFTYDYNDGAARQGGQLGKFIKDSTSTKKYAENTLQTFMADVIFKYQGFSILSEYAQKKSDKQLTRLSNKYKTGSGFNFQAGYLFKNNFELAGRYTTIRQDNKLSGIGDQDEMALGISKYFSGHNLKFQSDIARLTAPNVSDGTMRFRMQCEMQF